MCTSLHDGGCHPPADLSGYRTSGDYFVKECVKSRWPVES